MDFLQYWEKNHPLNSIYNYSVNLCLFSHLSTALGIQYNMYLCAHDHVGLSPSVKTDMNIHDKEGDEVRWECPVQHCVSQAFSHKSWPSMATEQLHVLTRPTRCEWKLSKFQISGVGVDKCLPSTSLKVERMICWALISDFLKSAYVVINTGNIHRIFNGVKALNSLIHQSCDVEEPLFCYYLLLPCGNKLIWVFM